MLAEVGWWFGCKVAVGLGGCGKFRAVKSQQLVGLGEKQRSLVWWQCCDVWEVRVLFFLDGGDSIDS